MGISAASPSPAGVIVDLGMAFEVRGMVSFVDRPLKPLDRRLHKIRDLGGRILARNADRKQQLSKDERLRLVGGDFMHLISYNETASHTYMFCSITVLQSSIVVSSSAKDGTKEDIEGKAAPTKRWPKIRVVSSFTIRMIDDA